MKEEKYQGLSTEEVEKLTSEGKINICDNNNLKTNWQITVYEQHLRRDLQPV